MATILRITLLSGRYGATPWGRSEYEGQVEYPPSPWRLLRAVLNGAFTFSGTPEQLPEGAEDLIDQLARTLPTYHLPFGEFGQIRGFRPAYGCEPVPPLNTKGYSHSQGKRRSFIDSFLHLGAGAALHVCWPVDLSPEQKGLLTDCLASLSYLGRAEYPALWQVVPTMPEANCVPDPRGTLSVLCCGLEQVLEGLQMNPQTARQEGRQAPPGQQWVSYRYEPLRPPAYAGGSQAPKANRAVFAFLGDYPIPVTAGIAWTDRLHRSLLQSAPASSLFSGLAGGQPLGEDQRAWYRWDEQGGAITALEVLSPQAFGEAEIDALQALQRLYGRGGVQVPLRLMRLDEAPMVSKQRLRTSTPMLLYTTPRSGKLQRSPAGQAIQSLLWGLGEQGKLDPSLFQQEEDAVAVNHGGHGRIRARVMSVVDEKRIVGRGERKAASGLGFHLELDTEHALPALGIGWGRHFGAGRLEAVA
ncbi:type I-U CRISPR-associated protein Csb2 [Synechococcus sp. CS-205]|uniref:type I-G CRISPR-associated protein Csb2 n=1 Tax=Synechococcus sp. CS-205 TaxID=2847984 RepID=UPI00223A88D6|nr:type I-U CRISPR-associated protein Csb2 [Synechococcus sp. CS-205]MCT0247873.1 type I-U CRISPR-associated protein Cas5/Cas6 [Synechococcus sp. CS-205]